MLATERKDHVPRNTIVFTMDIDEEPKGSKQPHLLEVQKHINTFCAANEL